MPLPTDRKAKPAKRAKAGDAAARPPSRQQDVHIASENGDLAMRRTKSRQAEMLNAQDALSLDDLDKVVGGSGDQLPTEGQPHYSEGPYPEGGGYHPPAPDVTAPANLPDPIHQI